MKITTNTRTLTTSIRRGFTLIELLVVMAIIAVLASISYGPIMGFLDRGKITEVRAMCNEFETAIDAFKAEYSYLPYGATHPDEDEKVITDASGKKFIEALTGANTDVNDKAISYLGIKTSKNNINNGVLEDGTIKDAWGNPFTIALDYDLDGQILPSLINEALGTKKQSQDSLSATPGKNKKWDDGSITSW